MIAKPMNARKESALQLFVTPLLAARNVRKERETDILEVKTLQSIGVNLARDNIYFS